ncbi:MAG TPA: tetratricopeptide repeat protein [Gemmataceae bacterium]|nr:tetratricopeptide repeat protein [Gemmataceae bacterium]
MSRTLNLADRLMAMGRNYQQLGRTQEALQIFERLAGFRSLRPAVAEETQAHLAEIYLSRCEFSQARRHLTAALAYQPKKAEYHYLLAMALEADEKADRQRAALHYRKSLICDPDQADCWSDFGLLCIRIGQPKEGLRSLRRAVELQPHDPEILANLVDGLQEEELHDEARRTLQAALFANACDARFRKLWNDFQFHELRREQERQRHGRAFLSAKEEGPTLLPFVRPSPGTFSGRQNRKLLRRDPPSTPAPPHTAQPNRRSNQSRVQ